MGYRWAANCLALVHFGFVLFVAFGALLTLRWPRLAWVHIPSAIWGATIEFRGWICPLTPLEGWLRRQGGEAGYSGGFVENYLIPMLYPEALTRQMQIGLGIAVLILNVGIYAIVVRRQRAKTS